MGNEAANFFRNLESVKYDDKKIISVYRGGGESGIEHIKLSNWRKESVSYFNRYFKQLNIIKIPSEKDVITETLSNWCINENDEGKGFVVNGYDIVDHCNFLGVSKKSLNELFNINCSEDASLRYIAFSKEKGVLLNIRVEERFEDEVIENSVSDIKLLACVYKQELQDSGVRLISLTAVKQQINETPLCTACEAYVVNENTLKNFALLKSWWEKIQANSKNIGNRKSNVSTEIYEILSSKLIAFMALSAANNFPDFSLHPNEQVAQTHLLLTAEQMSVLFMRDKHILVKGSYGSGKTIIAQKKLEMILRNINNDKLVLYLNYDERSEVHLQVAEYLKHLPLVDPKKLRTCDISHAFQQESEGVLVCSNAMGLMLSKILSIIKRKASEKFKEIYVIIDEYNGEDLNLHEVDTLRELLNFFRNLSIIVLVQPLDIQRIYKDSRNTFKSDGNKFEEFQSFVTVIELTKTFRTSLEIYKLLCASEEYLQNQKNVFIFPSMKQSDDHKLSLAKLNGVSGSLKKFSKSTGNLTQISEQNMVNTNINGIHYLDEAFRGASKLPSKNISARKTLSSFSYINTSKIGHSIKGPLPKLIRFKIKDSAGFNANVLAFFSLYKDLGMESKKTALIHFEKETPQMILKALELLELKIYRSENIETFITTNVTNNSVLVANFTQISGMEFENLVIILNKDEYYLRHFIPLCISRCMCDLSIILLKDAKSISGDENENLVSKIKLPCRVLPTKNSEMINIWKRRNLVQKWKIKICKKCDQGSNTYCISRMETSRETVMGLNINSAEFNKLRENIPKLLGDLHTIHAGADKEHLAK